MNNLPEPIARVMDLASRGGHMCQVPDRATKATKGFVYFVREVGIDGPVKIGWARDPALRFRGLQGGNPRSLRLLGFWQGTIADEHALHKRFAGAFIRGEWFRPIPELLAEVDRHTLGAGVEQSGRL